MKKSPTSFFSVAMEEDRTDALLDTTGGGGLLGSLDEAPSVTVVVEVLLMMLVLLLLVVMLVLVSELVKDWFSRVFNDDDELNFMLPTEAKLVDDDAPLSESCEMN